MSDNSKIILIVFVSMILLLLSCKQSKKNETNFIQSQENTTDEKYASENNYVSPNDNKIYGYSIMANMNPIEKSKAISKAQLMIAYQVSLQDFEYLRNDNIINIKREQSSTLSGIKQKEIRELNNGKFLLIMEYNMEYNNAEEKNKEVTLSVSQTIIVTDINEGVNKLIKDGIISIVKTNNIAEKDLTGKLSISNLSINETKNGEFEIKAVIGVIID